MKSVDKEVFSLFKKSPWDDIDDDNNETENKDSNNVFNRKRKNNNSFNFNPPNFQFNKNTTLIIVSTIFFVWLVSGIYKIEEGEQSVVMRFGKFNRVGVPGLNYRLPNPFESVTIERVNQSRRIEIGYRLSGRDRSGNANYTSEINTESIMLTGDQNIVELNADIMWHISDVSKYIFNVMDPEETLKTVSESAIREVIGNTPIVSILSDQKQEITEKIETLIQNTLDQYQSGIEIEQVQLLKAEPPKEVIQSYRDVQTAKADKAKAINQAQAYNNDIVPKARGEAVKILQEAEGYRAEVVAKAKGDASRFNAIYRQYANGKDVTKARLYLEAIESIMQDADKIVMSGGAMLPHMSLKQKSTQEKPTAEESSESDN